MAESGSRTGVYLYLLTLTAPGARRHCSRGDGCSYKRRRVDCEHADACSCTPTGGVSLGEWNPRSAACWNRLRTWLAREYPGVQFFRAVEVQDGKRGGSGRGALHEHVILRSDSPVDLERVRERAIAAGFGHSVDLAPFDAGSRKAAYYVSKYVSKACDARVDVPWVMETVDLDTGEVTQRDVPGRYRTWSSSREYGESMALVRAEAAVYARAAALKLVDQGEQAAIAALASVLGAYVIEPPPAGGPSPPG